LVATKGVSDLATLQETLVIPANFSISLWVATTESASGYLFCAATSSYPSGPVVGVKLNTDQSGVIGGGSASANKVRIEICGDAANVRIGAFTNAGLFDGDPHHLLIWHDSNTLKAWVDGVAQTITMGASYLGSLVQSTIDSFDLWGTSFTFTPQPADVTAGLAELAIVGREVSDDEVAELAAYSPLLLDPLPMRCWLMYPNDDGVDEIGEQSWGLGVLGSADHPPVIVGDGPILAREADMSRHYELYVTAGGRAAPGVDTPTRRLPRAASGASLIGLSYAPSVTHFVDLVAVNPQGRSTPNPVASFPVDGSGVPSRAPSIATGLAAAALADGYVTLSWNYEEANPFTQADQFEITLTPIGISGQSPVTDAVTHVPPQRAYSRTIGPLVSGLWQCQIRSVASGGAVQLAVPSCFVKADQTAPTATAPPLVAV